MKARLAPTVVSAVRVLAASLACVGVAAASPPAIAGDEAFEDALTLYSQGRWSAAYGRFAGLADAGNAEAARIALLMLRHGTALYGHAWDASPPRIDHWIALSHQRMKALNLNADD